MRAPIRASSRVRAPVPAPRRARRLTALRESNSCRSIQED
ncbi:unnamed protein product [Rhodiola kirilowii]